MQEWQSHAPPGNLGGHSQRQKKDQYSALREQLIDEVLGNHENSNKGTLFTRTQPGASQKAQNLSVTDWRILNWLKGSTTKAGQELLKCSSDESYSRGYWLFAMPGRLKAQKAIRELRQKLLKPEDIENWIEFQKAVQGEIIASLTAKTKKDEPVRHESTVIDMLEIDKIITSHQLGEVLVIVDSPAERPMSEVDLYFLTEHRIRGVAHLGDAAKAIDTSPMWSAIAENFQASAGKIRVFVHPEYADFFEAVLKPNEIEDILYSVAKRLKGK